MILKYNNVDSNNDNDNSFIHSFKNLYTMMM